MEDFVIMVQYGTKLLLVVTSETHLYIVYPKWRRCQQKNRKLLKSGWENFTQSYAWTPMGIAGDAHEADRNFWDTV
jgi:hypothetical protein